jgi:hypothetical protein
MGLTNIPNQPLHFVPSEADDCNTGDGKQYCALFNAGDRVYVQFKQEPCDDATEAMCDLDFSDLDGAIVNPAFDGSLTGWTNSGGWYYDNGKATINGANGEELEQNTSLVLGNNYTLQLTVSNYQGGNIDIEYAGTVDSIIVTGNGTYTASLTGGADTILIIRSNSFNGSIDNVVITDFPYTSDCYTVSDGWQLLPNIGAVHSSGTGSLTVFFTEVIMSGYQRVEIVVTDRTGGYVFVDDGSTQFPNITANGTYVFYTQCTGTFYLTPSDDFNGTIQSVSVRELRTDYSAYVEEIDTRVLTDITTSLGYYNEYVTINFDSSSLADGCYRIAVFDPCGENTNQEILENGTFPFGSWTLISGGTILLADKLTYTENGNKAFAIESATTPTIPENCSYELELVIGNVDASLLGTTIEFTCGGVYTFTINEANKTYRGVSSYDNNFLVSIEATMPTGAVNSDQLEILTASSKAFGTCITETGVNQFTNCFNIAGSQECAKQIEGYALSSAVKNGFYHHTNGTGFKLSARYRFLKFNPLYPTESEDYTYSNGRRELIYSSREKYWEGLFDYMDEDALDAITASMLSEVFTIDGIRYYVKPEDFKPEWAKDGTQRLAQLRVQMREIGSTIYNSRR